jgi:hypothetical protein
MFLRKIMGVALLIVLSITLASCGGSEPTATAISPTATPQPTAAPTAASTEPTQPAGPAAATEPPIPGQEIQVKMSGSLSMVSGGVFIIGSTNLPDNTKLSVTIQNDQGYSNQTECAVSAKSFQAGPFGSKDNPLTPGNYNVEIVTAAPGTQPDSVKALIGNNGQNLIGDMTVFGPTGRIVDYQTTIAVP